MTPDEIAYLRAQAQARGYNPDDLLKVIQYESSGIANNWGGKNNNYYGLIQFGPNERKTYGVDTVHPNARNQIDATMRFLADRGFKPGMGLIDLYSTVNAGSPGHYGASDRPGATVSSHVAKMMNMPVPQGASQPPGMSLSGLPADAMSYGSAAPTSSPKADPIGELLAMGGVQKQPKANLTQFVGSLLAEQDQPQQPQASSMNDEFIRQMMDFHSAQHQRAMQGLL